MAALAGCDARPSMTTLSETRGVCMDAHEAVIVERRISGPDYEVVTLRSGEVTVDVLIGGHPGFPQEVRMGALHATDGFRMLGEETVGGQHRVLYGQERGDKEGPLYVVFSAKDHDGIGHLGLDEKVLRDCR